MVAQPLDQYRKAQIMYSARPSGYEATWHPDYTKRFMDLVKVRPEDSVLDLACGTGLDAIRAAEDAGDGGNVVAVDATPEMLAVAQGKLDLDPVIARRLQLLQHDICRLDTCSAIQKSSFDLIICSNAFILLAEPARVISHWREYLKPGGRMAIDIPHERNNPSGLLVEKVAQRLGAPFPFDRAWVKSQDTFRELLESQGLEVETSTVLPKEARGNFYLDFTEADREFDLMTSSPLLDPAKLDEFKERARPLFYEEWKASADNGKLEVVDQLYVYIARKV